MTAWRTVRVLAAGLVVGVSLPWATGAAAQSAERGRGLYENHCLTCHYERIHKREPARSLVRSYTALQAEVARRAEMTKQRFSIVDLDDIAEYLNRSHYRFGR